MCLNKLLDRLKKNDKIDDSFYVKRLLSTPTEYIRIYISLHKIEDINNRELKLELVHTHFNANRFNWSSQVSLIIIINEN